MSYHEKQQAKMHEVGFLQMANAVSQARYTRGGARYSEEMTSAGETQKQKEKEAVLKPNNSLGRVSDLDSYAFNGERVDDNE
jgi:hypothetical protein